MKYISAIALMIGALNVITLIFIGGAFTKAASFETRMLFAVYGIAWLLLSIAISQFRR